MSRIGKKPIPVPKGVTVTVDGRTVSAKGPKGQQAFTVNDFCNVALGDAGVSVEPVDKSRQARAAWGMNRTMIANVVNGVANEFVRELELVGVGYRAALKGKSLNLALGYSHEIDFQPPEGITIVVPKPTEIVISGIDRQMVGQTAAKIRSFRPPEPYKGKGVKYKGEFIFRKEGKKK